MGGESQEWRTRPGEGNQPLFGSPSIAGSSLSFMAPGSHLGRRSARVSRAGQRSRSDGDGSGSFRRRARGTNIRHQLGGLLRQAVYGRLAGYEAMPGVSLMIQRCVRSSGREVHGSASSLDQPDGAVRDQWLATVANLAALADRRPLPQGAKAQVPLCRGVSAHGAAPEAVSRLLRPAAHAGADPGTSHHSAATACAVCARSQSAM